MTTLRRAWWIAAVAALAAMAGAAAAQDWRCDCSRIVSSCSANVSIEDEMLHITSSTKACSTVEYFLDDDYRLTSFFGGFTAMPLRRPPSAAGAMTAVPQPPLFGDIGPPTAGDRLPAVDDRLPPATMVLPPIRTRVASCRVCFDRSVEAGRRDRPLVGQGGQTDHQCAAAAAETRRLIQECGAQASAGTLDYTCTTSLMEANNRVAALCN